MMAKALAHSLRIPANAAYETVGFIRQPSLASLRDKARYSLRATFKPRSEAEIWQLALKVSEAKRSR